MPPSPKKLSTKIIGMLVIFFLIAFAAISMTLLVSWRLEGGAAAINDAGSERMRSYRIAHLLAQATGSDDDLARVAPVVREEVARFDRLLRDIEQGVPARPLSPPRDADTQQRLLAVGLAWEQVMRPQVEAFLAAPDGTSRQRILARYNAEVGPFVQGIDQLVLAMERNYAYNTTLLRSFQLALVALALLGTAILIHFFFRLVIRPVESLYAGIQRMAGDDLAVRLPVERRDEFGALAQGFNQMAEHLEGVYSTLEERVETKTRSLAARNQELGILYEITAFLNEPASMEELCDGFTARIRRALGAEGAAVRLYSQDTDELILVANEGLSEQFQVSETALRCGDCLCSDVMYGAPPAAFEVNDPPGGMRLKTCVREGFVSATAFPIIHNKQRLGIYNLYFRQHRMFSAQETHLLETLGRNLGVAVENMRLRSREKEMAVSEERNLLAQELHDSIAQGLAFLNIQVQLLQDSLNKGKVDEALAVSGELREGVQESYDDVRELLVHFRTRLHQTDLDSAILSALGKFESQTGVSTEFERAGSGVPLAPEDQIQVMHIVQESLSNIRKHARARAVKVSVQRSLAGITIEVADDGVGFDPLSEPALKSDRHVGLKIMTERAQRVGGQCRVSSALGQGTRVTLSLPRLHKEAA